MRLPSAIAIVAFLWLTPVCAGADEQLNAMITGVAQQYVAEAQNLPAESRFSLAFDISYIHPQPEGNYWAVVGGFMGELTPNRYGPHSYVAAVRLICDDCEDLDCWRLDKLAIDDRVVYDIGQSAYLGASQHARHESGLGAG